MALISVQPLVSAGTAIALAAATATTGDTVPLDNNTTVLINNGSGSSINVTITSKVPAREGYAVTDKVVPVAAGALKALLLDPVSYNDPTTGVATIVCSAVTTVTIGAIRHP